MLDLGVRLQLLIGPTVPVPAPYAVVDALISLEVRNNDRGPDGFKMEFSLGKEPLLDYGLLRDGLLDPPNRVTIMVLIQGLPQVLINGMITKHEVIPSREPGQSRLHVTGEDTGLELDLEEKSVTYKNQPDSVILTQIVTSYGLVPVITPTTEFPIEVDRITTQQDTDLKFIRKLARRNNFVFYLEPTAIPGRNKAYCGPEQRIGLPQAFLTHDMGSETNVDYIHPGFSALDPVTPKVTITEPFTRQQIPIPIPSGIMPSLAGRAASPLRTTVSRDSANLNLVQGMLRALIGASQGGDAVTASGRLDAVQYGRALRARQLVGVRGVGHSYDGLYYVQQVTHNIKRGEYKQDFQLKREGVGALPV